MSGWAYGPLNYGFLLSLDLLLAVLLFAVASDLFSLLLLLPTEPAFSGSGPGPPVGAMFELLTVWPVVPSSILPLLALAVSERPQPIKSAAIVSVVIKTRVRRIESSSCARKGKLLESDAQAELTGMDRIDKIKYKIIFA